MAPFVVFGDVAGYYPQLFTPKDLWQQASGVLRTGATTYPCAGVLPPSNIKTPLKCPVSV